MSSEGEDELRTEAALPKSRPEASAAGGSGDDSTQVVRLSESGAADSVDQLKTLLQSAEVSGPGLEAAESIGAGRYRLDRILGEGAFGRVYLGYDTELRRAVAVKVPSPGRFSSAAELENYLSEARMAAQLDHPNAVTVYDAGRTAAGGVYVVSQFIDGGTLESEIRAGGLTEREAVRLLIPVARALHAAHLRKIIHRDVKPANILISRVGRIPYVADFGLAIHGDQHPAEYAIAGTPAYMSPEQARGEGHRLDGRSDLFSLGVVMYEMLTDSRPFRGGSLRETLSQVISAAPRSLREFRARIPSELERICLKALAKRAVDRYGDLEEFANELQMWLDGNGAGGQLPGALKAVEVRLIPRGLHCFTRDDAAAYLRLLPGPVDRDGLAESVSFWVRRLSGSDAGPPLQVGVIYGPSGCGKSSLMRAGIVPRLAAGVDVLYVEAAGVETERRLESALRRCVPGLPVQEDLAGLLALIRQRRQRRLVLVIDQLEQWLSGRQLEADGLLVRALRQCEGEYLKAMLLVRDDYALGTARLMSALEIPMRQGENTAVVDLFDEEHAERVLEQFGRAWGRLPREGALSAAQMQFLRMAVEQVSEAGRVVCVRLVVLSELVRQREWEPQTLEALGGAEGAGVAYLESVFEGRGANPALRMQSEAARRLLRAMLPAGQLVIRGSAKTSEELRVASGFGADDRRFEELLNVLDRDLRLLTPIDSDADSEAGVAASVGVGVDRESGSRYQLTHDFLVPSIHAWLSRRQRETLRGRTELLLAERSGTWNLRRTAGNLPSLREWLWIRCLVSAAVWTRDERRMMQAAARQHLLRWGLAGAVGVALAGVLRWNEQRLASQRMLERMVAEVDALRDVRGTELTRAVGELTADEYPPLILRQRLQEERDRETDLGRRLPLALALSALDVDESEYLTGQVLNPLLPDSAVLVAGLAGRAEAAINAIGVRIEALKDRSELQQRARLAVVALQLGESRWSEAMCRAGVSDPIERVWWIREASTWGGFGRGIGELQLAGSSDLNAAMMLALRPAVGVRMSRYAEERLRLRVEQLVGSPDAGEHAAAVRLLAALTSGRGGAAGSVSGSTGQNAGWRLINDGLTLIRIPGGVSAAAAGPRAVWMSDREVSQGLFQQFVDDPTWPAEEKPDSWEGPDRDVGDGADYPVQQVSHTDAVLFCNWLSQRCGMSACYVRMQTADGAEMWVLSAGVAGFRLPTEDEWERACRWGTTTTFHCSDDESFLPDYARISAASTLPVGSLLPNAGGFYDMHGNVMEWCEPSNGERVGEYAVRGGAFLTGPADSESGFSMRFPGTDRYDLAGFRVVLSE